MQNTINTIRKVQHKLENRMQDIADGNGFEEQKDAICKIIKAKLSILDESLRIISDELN